MHRKDYDIDRNNFLQPRTIYSDLGRWDQRRYSHDSYANDGVSYEDYWNPTSANDTEYIGKGPKGYKRPDESIHEEVCEALKHNADVDARGIEVYVENGHVKLEGVVHGRVAKHLAGLIADTVSGVEDIENNISSI
jgi:osmotically-inducible protein OsmY